MINQYLICTSFVFSVCISGGAYRYLGQKEIVSRENLRSLPSESTQVRVRMRVCLSRDSRLDVDILKNPCSCAEDHKDLALHRGRWRLPSFSNFLKQTDEF